MIERFVYLSSMESMTTDFHSEEGIICGVNIKAFKEKEKTVKEAGIPVLKKTTTWGLFLHIRMPNDDQYDAIWELEKTFTKGLDDVPRHKVAKKRDRYFIEPTVAKVFRACGVNEWVDLIGTKIRVKPMGGLFPANNGFGISPTDEQSGRWFYPEYYEIHTGGVNNG